MYTQCMRKTVDIYSKMVNWFFIQGRHVHVPSLLLSIYVCVRVCVCLFLCIRMSAFYMHHIRRNQKDRESKKNTTWKISIQIWHTHTKCNWNACWIEYHIANGIEITLRLLCALFYFLPPVPAIIFRIEWIWCLWFFLSVLKRETTQICHTHSNNKLMRYCEILAWMHTLTTNKRKNVCLHSIKGKRNKEISKYSFMLFDIRYAIFVGWQWIKSFWPILQSNDPLSLFAAFVRLLSLRTLLLVLFLPCPSLNMWVVYVSGSQFMQK